MVAASVPWLEASVLKQLVAMVAAMEGVKQCKQLVAMVAAMEGVKQLVPLVAMEETPMVETWSVSRSTRQSCLRL